MRCASGRSPKGRDLGTRAEGRGRDPEGGRALLEYVDDTGGYSRSDGPTNERTERGDNRYGGLWFAVRGRADVKDLVAVGQGANKKEEICNGEERDPGEIPPTRRLDMPDDGGMTS